VRAPKQVTETKCRRRMGGKSLCLIYFLVVALNFILLLQTHLHLGTTLLQTRCHFTCVNNSLALCSILQELGIGGNITILIVCTLFRDLSSYLGVLF
jgi:hypothetical protein